MRTFTALHLGATLFSPAINKNIPAILRREKYPELKSLLIDLEDGIADADFENALTRVKYLLSEFVPNDLLLFIRPRDSDTLARLLQLQGIEKIDGFILPKFSLEHADSYLRYFTTSKFAFMPSIEGAELFQPDALREIRTLLTPYKMRIPCVRIGCEDMFRMLHMQRERGKSIFDYSVGTQVLGDMLRIFKPHGYDVCGCVYPYFDDTEGFIKDVKRDLSEGLCSKTVIHPAQIAPLHRCYRVDTDAITHARELLSSKYAVFAQKGKMAERKTQIPYAKQIVARAKIYGVIPKRKDL